MNLLNAIGAKLFSRPEPIVSSQALADFLDSRASFLSQKGVVEFCRVRAGVYWQKLFMEEEFQELLGISLWLSYPACYSILAEMTEGMLREAAGLRRTALPSALEALARDTFMKYELPPGEAEDFWDNAARMVRQRLDDTQSAPPRPIRYIAEPSAKIVFDALPIHPSLVAKDYDYIFNFLRMNVLRIHEDLSEVADFDAIADDLLGLKGT
jgi:hypothetical protein